MDLQDLFQTLGQMSDADLQAMLHSIRQNRRVPKDDTKQRKKAEAKPKANKPGANLDALLASALQNPAMKEALLKQLMGGK